MNNMSCANKYVSYTRDKGTVDYKNFLTLLGKITESIPHPDTELEIVCKEFDTCLHFEGGLEEKLSQAMFPDISQIIQKLSSLSDSLEQISLFPELNLKPIWLWAAQNTGILFQKMAPLFRVEIPASLKRYNTIPFLITNSDDLSLEVLNFANSRVEINLSEFSLLLSGKEHTRVALDQIIKMFILHIPLKEYCGAYVFDTKYGNGQKRLNRFLANCFCVLKDTSELKEDWTNYYELKICDEKKGAVSDKKYISFESFLKKFPLQTKVPIYGFFDEFLSIKNKVMTYYLSAIAEKRRHVMMLRNDIVMLENSDILNTLWQKEEKAEELLKEEEKSLSDLFTQSTIHIERIRDILNDVMTEKRYVPIRISNLIFEAFFDSQGLSRKYTDSVVARMKVLDIPQLPMVNEFLLQAKRIPHSSDTKPEKTVIPQKVTNWIDAKIVLALFHLPQPKIPLSPGAREKLSIVLKYAEQHISTGKEYYIKYLIQDDPDFLWKSMELDYQPSGEVLYSLYHQDKEKLARLANFLIPAACYALGREQIENYLNKIKGNRINIFSFDNDAFFYMKIAASMRYIPALTYFAELFYDYFFSSCEVIEQSDAKRLNYAKITIGICRFLLQQHEYIYRDNIKKILGVTAFCTQDINGLKIARDMLIHLYFPEAKYCLGYMYEFGKGYVQNLHRAKKMMQDAGEYPPAKARIRPITSKINLKKAQAAKAEKYEEDEDYSSRSHTSCSSSSCIILAILGIACTSGNIRKMHTFAHRELLTSEIGKNIICEYYRTGSQIMARLNDNPNAKEEYETLRKEFFSNTFSAVQRKNYHEAAENMIDMQLRLCMKYDVKVQTDLLIKLRQKFPGLEIWKQGTFA